MTSIASRCKTSSNKNISVFAATNNSFSILADESYLSMSRHFEFQLAFNFIENLPLAVVQTLEFLTGQRADQPIEWPDPDSDFIGSEDARIPLLSVLAQGEPNCGENVCAFRSVYRYTRANCDVYQYTLHFRCLWLDDDFFHTWWRLVPWLAKYSDATGYVGYYKEELEAHPTLIYFHQGKVYFREVLETPVSIITGQPWDAE